MSLAALRSDPKSACMRNVYRTGPRPGSFDGGGAMVEGGRCRIEADEISGGVFDLEAEESALGSDYYFPWKRTGVGWVKVPKNAPDGTIVLTGGVNGCSIVVSENLNDYCFYHDGDSKYLHPHMIAGNEVARVRPKDYDPLGWDHNQFQRMLEEGAKKGIQPKGDVSYGHFVVAVKKGGRFGFYVTGLISFNGYTKLPARLSTCIVTFGDDD